MSTSGRRIAVNEAFRPQRVTGQQRYAREIADRLEQSPGVVAAAPGSWFAASGLKTWAWVLAVLPIVKRRAVLVSLTARTPVYHPRHVVVVHDLFVLTNPEWYSKKYVLSHVPLLKAALRTAKAVVAVSEPVAREVEASGLTRAPVTVAPNAPSPFFGSSAEVFGSSAEAGVAGGADGSAGVAPANAGEGAGADAVLGRLALTPGRFILVVGSLDPRKNLARLAEAYALVEPALQAEYPLVVVGGGHAIFNDVGVTWPAGTIAAGYVTDPELAALYRSARGVVFPSLAEGFGLPLVEAAVSGARLAVSDIEVFRWIGGQSVRYFDPTSTEAIARSLTELMTDETFTVDAEFAASIRTRFDWQKSAAVVMEACRTVARA